MLEDYDPEADAESIVDDPDVKALIALRAQERLAKRLRAEERARAGDDLQARAAELERLIADPKSSKDVLQKTLDAAIRASRLAGSSV